jgi:predicted AAA+ superfamily ATPase
LPPETLDAIAGQPAIVRNMKQLAAHPTACCVLLEGRGGVGKNAMAKAFANDLGVCELTGLHESAASDLTIDAVRDLFGRKLRLRPMSGCPWHVLIVEELELLPSRNVSAMLKDALSEQHMPEHLIVVATSNDASGLDEALLQRFDIYSFACGPSRLQPMSAICEEIMNAIPKDNNRRQFLAVFQSKSVVVDCVVVQLGSWIRFVVGDDVVDVDFLRHVSTGNLTP